MGMKIKIGLFLIVLIGLATMACTDASVASSNLSKAADQFEIYRRVVFYNSITNTYILTVEGYCSIMKDGIDNQLELTVKVDHDRYLKHYLGLSDNVTYFAEQIKTANVSTGRYRVVFKPSVIIPIIDIE